MRQLRHVLVFSCVLPTQQEEATSALENLETLDKVFNFVCSREIPEIVPNLRKLCIIYREMRDYELHNLVYFQKLEILKIQMSLSKPEGIIPLEFPPTLKKLSLRGLQCPWKNMKTVASLPHLQELKLRDEACVGSEWETSEGGFSQLNFLQIRNSSLKHWTAGTTHFPRLKCLVLLHCPLLKEIPDSIGEIPTLELIEVNDYSLQRSAKRIQEDRQSLGNYSLQVRADVAPYTVRPRMSGFYTGETASEARPTVPGFGQWQD